MTLSPNRRQLIAAMVLGSLALPAYAQGLPPDVPSDAWASTAVTNLVDKWQILGLSPQGHFNGHQDVSRYELAETFWRVVRIVERQQAVDLSAVAGSSFHFGDVEAQHEAAVDAVVNRYGFFADFPGLDRSRFAGGQSVKRYELALLMHGLMRRADEQKIAVTGRGPDLAYRDLPASHWATPLLRDLTQRYGLLIGYPDQTFRGDKRLNRYELAIALDAALHNLLEKQFQAVVSPQPAAAPMPERVEAPKTKPPLPGFESDWQVHAGRHDERDLAAGAGFDLGWWLGKLGETRPGIGFTGDYGILLNRASQPLVHAGQTNLELRWRLTGVDSSADPYLYLGAGYHGDAWFAPAQPLYLAHGLGLTVAGGLPTNVWDLWALGRLTHTSYLFPDTNFAKRPATGQTFFLGLEKRFDDGSGLRLGYTGSVYETFPTGGSGTFLPINRAGVQLGGHWAF